MNVFVFYNVKQSCAALMFWFTMEVNRSLNFILVIKKKEKAAELITAVGSRTKSKSQTMYQTS